MQYNSWIFHHDNAPAHMAMCVREFIATKQITVLGHCAYLPDLARNEFFLLPKIKETLKRTSDIFSINTIMTS